MPVRKIPKNYRNVTGIAAHRKAIGQAMFESTLERDFLTLLEFNQAVARFEVQPLVIHWFDEFEKERTYTPDTLVYYHHNKQPTTLYEVKYRSDLKKSWTELKPKFRAARLYAKNQNWRFKLVTEVEIRGTKLDNARFLLPYIKRAPTSEIDMDILDTAINQLVHTTPNKLLEYIYKDEWNRARLLPTLWYLIGTYQIGVDLNRPLTMSSSIWRLNA